MNKKTLNLVLLALFIALSVVGANIKVMGSIAFDSFPAFLAAILMGPLAGGIVGALGHFVSSALAGFPLTLPLHIAITLEMGLICAFVGWLAKNKNLNIWLVAVIAFLLNAVLGLAVVVVWPGMGMAVASFLFAPLSIASALNVIIAVALAIVLKKPYQKMIASKN